MVRGAGLRGRAVIKAAARILRGAPEALGALGRDGLDPVVPDKLVVPNLRGIDRCKDPNKHMLSVRSAPPHKLPGPRAGHPGVNDQWLCLALAHGSGKLSTVKFYCPWVMTKLFVMTRLWPGHDHQPELTNMSTSHSTTRPNYMGIDEIFQVSEAFRKTRDRTPTSDEYASNRPLRRFVKLLRAPNDPPPRFVKIVHLEGVRHTAQRCAGNVRSMMQIDPTIDVAWGYQVWINALGGLRAAVHAVVVRADGAYLDVTDCPDEDTTLFIPSSKALSPLQRSVALTNPDSIRLGVVVGGTKQYVDLVMMLESHDASIHRLVTNPEDMVVYMVKAQSIFVVPRTGPLVLA